VWRRNDWRKRGDGASAAQSGCGKEGRLREVESRFFVGAAGWEDKAVGEVGFNPSRAFPEAAGLEYFLRECLTT